MNKVNKIGTAIAVLSILVLAAVVVSGYMNRNELLEKNQELQDKLNELTKEEERSTVMQRVNAQMEEIANEERRISEEQRIAAEEQTKVAEQMRQHAEAERQNALVAEKKALEASEVAQKQRIFAEQQRAEAEWQKRVTDTLSYATLARTIGNTAIQQYSGGNKELADLLAYTAVLFTERYHGDIYASTVYQALSTASQNKKTWNKHKGSITDVAFSDNKEDYFVSCSTYGEVIKHHMNNGKLTSETLFSNSKFDFRDIFINRTKNVIYAISRTGELVVINGKNVKVLPVNIQKLTHIENVGEQFLLFGENGMAQFDAATNTISQEKILPYRITLVSRYDNAPIVFDDQGRIHIFRSFTKDETSRIPVKGQVTAFAESKSTKLKAYGMSDGSIWLDNGKGKTTKLIGHRSRVSKIKLNGSRLYSSSYDGTIILWMTNMAKIEPMMLFSTNGWIINFTFDPKKKNIWTGDQRGNLTQACISVPMMIDLLKNKLKRNFTREEWQYYIGKNVPYEEVISEK